MKRQFILILLQFLFTYKPNAQIFEWAKQFGGSGISVAYSLTTDDDRNLYLTGTFAGTIDFNPGPGVFNLTSNGNRFDIFVVKLNQDGQFIWAKQISGTLSEDSHTIFVDNFRNVYVAGQFEGTVDFNPGAGTFNLTAADGTYDAFIFKLDASGNFIWAKNFNGDLSHSAIQSIYLDTDQNILATGRFNSTVDFDPGAAIFNLTSAGGDDVFVLKLDASGNFVWVRQMGGEMDEYSSCITLDTSGNIYTTGVFQVLADFDPGIGIYNLSAFGRYDIFLSKLDPSGNFVWAKRLGGDKGNSLVDDQGVSIVIDKNGNLYTTGQFRGTADFDPGPATHNLIAEGGTDVYVLKLDLDANFKWVKRIGGLNNSAFDIALDNNGNVYTSGRFQYSGDFNPGAGTFILTSTGHDDTFISKLDSSGNFVWAIQIGGPAGEDRAISIVVDKYSNVYSSGYFTAKADFDPGPATYYLTTNGINDVFIHKMSQCENSTIDMRTACDSLVWIDGKTYKSSTNSPRLTLKNTKGCDSVVVLNLNVYKSYSNTIIQTACDSFYWNGKTYFTSGNYIHKTQSPFGCDSTSTLNLTIHRSSSFTEQITACDQYNWHGQTYDLSGTYINSVKTNAGCDSINRLELKINHSNKINLTYEACNSYTWNGQIYTQSGLFTYDTTNRFGCDSSIVLNLIINRSTSTTIIDTACQAFVFNDIHYSNSGKYYQTIKNANNCDSLIELDLTIIKLENGISKTGNLLNALENHANYQWVDCDDNYSLIPGATNQNFLPDRDGRYAVILSASDCVDTSECLQFFLTQTNNSGFSNVRVFPNPVSDKIYIDYRNTYFEENLIIIRDIQGRNIFKMFISKEDKSTMEFDISLLPAGMYYLCVITNRQMHTYSLSKI